MMGVVTCVILYCYTQLEYVVVYRVGVAVPKRSVKATLQNMLFEAVKQRVKLIPQTSTVTVKEDSGEQIVNKKRKGEDRGEKTKKQKAEDTKPVVKIRKATYAKRKTMQEKEEDQLVLNYLVAKHFSKMGHAVFYLRKLWTDDPTAKILVACEHLEVLKGFSRILAQYGIDHTVVEGNKNKIIHAISFKKSNTVSTTLMCMEDTSTSSDLIEASYILFFTEIYHPIESQIIARVCKGGIKERPTVVRFIMKNSVEYQNYVGISKLPIEKSEQK